MPLLIQHMSFPLQFFVPQLSPWSFVGQYDVSFLVLQSPRWGNEGWLLGYYCLLDVMLMLFYNY